MHAEVIVVGGGPAGSTAAREIASRGHQVLLLDRDQFPRDKACGGGVSEKCAALLPFDLSPVIERVATGAILGDPASGMVTRSAGGPLLYLTQRRRLDAFLLDRARDAGVEIREEHQVRSVVSRSDGTYEVTARAEGEAEVTHTARVVVGADGANGIVARIFGLAQPRERGVALEGNLPCPDGIPTWLEGQILISFATVPGGYGWLFPKGDHINIGVGGLGGAGPALRPELERFAGLFGWDVEDLRDVRGHHLPLWCRDRKLVSGGVAVVGDAAGLVEALLGEGIYSAVASAGLLAPVVDRFLAGETDCLDEYQQSVDREVAPTLERFGQLAAILHAWPRPVLWMTMRSELPWRLAAMLMRSERRGTGHLLRNVSQLVLRPFAWAARRRGACIIEKRAT